jgi:hypothetical protein
MNIKAIVVWKFAKNSGEKFVISTLECSFPIVSFKVLKAMFTD